MRWRLGPWVAIGATAFLARAARAPEPDDAGAPALAIWTWGSNLSGQLGRVPANQHVPGAVAGLSDAVSVAAGLRHTLALRSDGTVWAWGDNSHGQLGTSGMRLSLAPVPVPGLSGITSVVAGREHSMALRASDGKLWAWGSNASGQLGQPLGVTAVSTPTELPAPAAIVEVAAGGAHTLLLDENGDVWSWGLNVYGQLGDGSTTDRAEPRKAQLSRIVDIAAGTHHNLAVDTDGAVWAWGLNSFGQLGYGVQNGWTEAIPNPVQAVGLPPIAEVAAGQLHSLARSRGGRVFGWGYNTSGQVGDGSVLPANTGRLAPAELALSEIVEIAAGGIHGFARRADGTVYIWGSNARGAIGNNSTDDVRVPTPFLRLPGLTRFAGGGAHTVVLAPAPTPATAHAAGRNDLRQLGDGSTVDRHAFVPIALADVLQLAVGESHSLALTTDGRVRAWGDNRFGQLGVAGSPPSSVEVPLPTGENQRIVAVAAGRHFSLALRSDGSIWAWGDNSRQQLGGAATGPARMAGLGDVVAIAAGSAHGTAVGSDGSVWAWGDNSCGQLGLGRDVQARGAPVQIAGILVASRVAAGECHSFAVTEGGDVYAWGANEVAQLGNDSISPARVAVRTRIERVTSIAAGGYHGVASVSGGHVMAWGDANHGALGTGTSFDHRIPRRIASLLGVETMAAGRAHSLSVGADGTAYGWGVDQHGLLGFAELGFRGRPTAIAGAVRVVAAGWSHTLIATD